MKLWNWFKKNKPLVEVVTTEPLGAETPDPAPGPVCKNCPHTKWLHEENWWKTATYCLGADCTCPCTNYEPTTGA